MTLSRTVRQARPPATALALAVATTLVACGGSGGLSRADFIKKADAICRDGQGSFATIQATPPRSAGEAARQVGKLIATVQGEIDQLRALTPPQELRSPLDTYLKARATTIPLFRKAEDAAKRNRPQAYADAWREITAGHPNRYDLARKVGLTICSKPRMRAATGDARPSG